MKPRSPRRATAAARAPLAGLEVQIAWRGTKPWVPAQVVREAVAATLRSRRSKLRRLSIAFVGDREIARLHAEWLGDPTVTDVITFDLRPAPPRPGSRPLAAADDGPEAELVVGARHARRIAQERGVPARRELILYVVHGVLHLCGLDDRRPADRAAMRRAEARDMRGLGHGVDEGEHDG
jgi:rRNA maturation RNase YbeY